ncbi:hypothetical protein IID22_04610 [Patescibacteria group bacterium]|nr:hypothetical protein [Patescibacteria group bacterium]
MAKTQAKDAENFSDLIENLSEKRKDIVETLLERKWFKKTKFELQKQLLTLPDDFDGFLFDLGNRPETIGQVDVLKLTRLTLGNYIAVPMFKVRSLLTNQIFTYEYASWKHGRFPGYKGIVLVEVDNEIKFFFIKKGYKFPTGSQVYDAIGTWHPTFSRDKLIHLQAKIEKQVKKLLGVEDIQIKRFIDLGLLNTDAGMTNNHSTLFAVIITIDDAERIKKFIAGKKLSALAPGYELEIHPIDRLLAFVTKSDDSFFLACVARLMALNIVKL